MIKSYVEAPPSKRVTDPPLLIRSKHDKRNGLGGHGAEFWNAELLVAQQFEKQSLELVIDLVDFVDEKDTGFVFT